MTYRRTYWDLAPAISWWAFRNNSIMAPLTSPSVAIRDLSILQLHRALRCYYRGNAQLSSLIAWKEMSEDLRIRDVRRALPTQFHRLRAIPVQMTHSRDTCRIPAQAYVFVRQLTTHSGYFQ
jgi:hypothetical protein